ncbi:MAG: ABC transporter substrate-binding protein [Chloroflexia bacterium]|nr:ABC transporter substrate-binding protein [Chloroflexia bacterium]
MPARFHRFASLLALLTLLVVPGVAAQQSTPVSCTPAPLATPAADAEPAPGIPPVQVPDGATQVTMGYTPASIFAPVFVAREKGYFAEQGLDVELQALAGGSDMVVLTATGEFDAGIAGVGPAFWNGANQGLPLTIIAPGHAEGSPVATPLMISRAACEGGEIASVADLAGKRVSVNARGATEYWLSQALGTAGLTLDDIDLQTLAFPDAVTALQSGAIAGAMIGEPLASRAEQEGIAVRLATDFPVQNIQPTVIFGNDVFLAENPDAAAGLVAGYLKAARDLTSNFNDPVNLAIIEQYTNVPASLIASSVKPVYAPDGTIDLTSLSTLQQFFRERGQLDYDQNLDPATLVDDQYVIEARARLGD